MSHVIAMPGLGFDAQFAYDSYELFAHTLGHTIESFAPCATDPIGSCVEHIHRQREDNDVILAGISITAAVSIAYALDHNYGHKHTIEGIIASLPPWIADDYSLVPPSKQSAQFLAHQIRSQGLDDAIYRMQQSTEPWLSTYLTRSWSSIGPQLADMCTTCAEFNRPTGSELRKISVPCVVIGLIDDSVHPPIVARRWAKLIGRASYQEGSLMDVSQNLSEFSLLALKGWNQLTCPAESNLTVQP